MPAAVVVVVGFVPLFDAKTYHCSDSVLSDTPCFAALCLVVEIWESVWVFAFCFFEPCSSIFQPNILVFTALVFEMLFCSGLDFRAQTPAIRLKLFCLILVVLMIIQSV